jgi:hypothetical protein
MFKDEKRTQYSPLMTREEQVRRRARRARARAIRRIGAPSQSRPSARERCRARRARERAVDDEDERCGD